MVFKCMKSHMVNLCGQKKECALVYKMETAALKMSS